MQLAAAHARHAHAIDLYECVEATRRRQSGTDHRLTLAAKAELSRLRRMQRDPFAPPLG